MPIDQHGEPEAVVTVSLRTPDEGTASRTWVVPREVAEQFAASLTNHVGLPILEQYLTSEELDHAVEAVANTEMPPIVR